MKNLDDILELEEEKEFNFNLDVSIEESLDYTSIDKSDGNIIRIEETIGDGWHGVRNCCSSDRVDSVANRIKDKWVAKKMFENRHLRWVRYGNEEGSARCTQSRNTWTGERSCRGRLTLPVYIEFRKP